MQLLWLMHPYASAVGMGMPAYGNNHNARSSWTADRA
jgi:hypothetical protein